MEIPRNKLNLSRRYFIKYLGTSAGLFFARHFFGNPDLAFGNDNPRVVSIHDSGASNYNYLSGYHWEYVNRAVINDMVELGVMTLTGNTNAADAWRDLIPYKDGESVLIKFNFNNSSGCYSGYDNLINPIAETANAVIEGLMSIGVPGDKIWFTDPSRSISERFRNGMANTSIQYFSTWPCDGPNYHGISYVTPSSSAVSLASCPAGEKILPSQVFVDADHVINVPILKSHGSYVTLALKNHYGSVLYENHNRSTMHAYFNQGGNIYGCDLNTKNILADINNNPHIRDKTRLVIGDGIFGNAHTHWGAPQRWNIFGQKDPNILFFSKDPVAISSVMTDYIMAERGWQDHEQLHAADFIGLGVHDHWNNFENKAYTLIDYINIETDDLSKAIVSFQTACGLKPLGLSGVHDVSGDQRVGLEEAIYFLQKIAGLRP